MEEKLIFLRFNVFECGLVVFWESFLVFLYVEGVCRSLWENVSENGVFIVQNMIRVQKRIDKELALRAMVVRLMQ